LKLLQIQVAVVVVALMFSSQTVAQERDPILEKLEELREAYEDGNLEKAVSISIELKGLLEKKSPSQQEVARKKQTNSQLDSPISILNKATLQKFKWSLSIAYRDHEYPPISHDSFMTAMNEFKQYEPMSEYRLAAKYRTELRNALEWFSYYCDNIGVFLDNIWHRPIPFRFAEKDGRKYVFLTDLASETVYNTLRSTSKSRAATVLTSCLLPKLSQVYDALKSTEFDYFAFTIIYGSKDFLDNSDALNLKAEMLGLVVQKDKCKDFINGEITESEFLQASDVYICDRNMYVDVKKVKLAID